MKILFFIRKTVLGAGCFVVALLAACAGGSTAHAVIIIPVFDSSLTADPNAAAIEATINCCIAEYNGALLDPTVVTITFVVQSTGLGASYVPTTPVTYSAYRSALASHATSSEDSTALASISNTATNPVNASTGMIIQEALALTLGLATDPAANTVFLNTSICNVNPETDHNSSNYALFAVACHEIDEILGGGGAGSQLDVNTSFNPSGPVGPLDLFRYSASGVRSYNTNGSATSYLSINGGVTSLVPFNQNDTGDFSDFASSSALVQNAFGTPGAQPVLAVEWNMLDFIGYNWNGHTNIWISATAASGAGTVYSPTTFNTALGSVASGACILMKAGAYSHSGSISTPCKLRAVNGTARIQ